MRCIDHQRISTSTGISISISTSTAREAHTTKTLERRYQTLSLYSNGAYMTYDHICTANPVHPIFVAN